MDYFPGLYMGIFWCQAKGEPGRSWMSGTTPCLYESQRSSINGSEKFI